MRSLNFQMAEAYPQVDRWGAEAEDLYAEQPDLSLVRCRQLLELAVSVLEGRNSLPRNQAGLRERLDKLEAIGAIDRSQGNEMHGVRQLANEAIHIRTTRHDGPRRWADQARKALRLTARIWCRVARTPLPTTIRLPDAHDIGQQARQMMLLKLDEAEAAVEDDRDFEGAERLLASLDPGKLARRKLSASDLDLLQIRIASIRTAASNHRGEPPAPLDPQKHREVVARGDAALTDEVVHLHNRHAVGMLNLFRIEEALAAVDVLEEWRSGTSLLATGPFEDLHIRDRQRGALLGTKGQALAMLAHATGDSTLLNAACTCFEQARSCFEEPADIERQHVYLLHADIERVRLGAELDEEARERLESVIDSVPHGTLDAQFKVESFAVGAALKAGWALGCKVPWAGRLAHQLDTLWTTEKPLLHPYEQIAGGLLLLHPAAAHRLIPALERTRDAGGLIGWISACYLAQHRGEAAPEPPEAFATWWDHDGVRAWTDGHPATAVLPFNYA